MKDYAVLEALKRTAASKIENAFERGFEQGYNDCKVELTEEEAEAHYDEGYKDGYEKGKQEILDTIAKSITSFDEIKKSEYDKGYKDACNDKDLITCKKSDEISDKAYKDGYNKGIHELMTINVFEGIKLAEYNKGYGAGYKDAYEIGKKDGQKAERMLLHEPLKKDLEEAYQKGLKHGQELRAKEAECAEACGMKRAWDAARKVILSPDKGGLSSTNIHQIFDTSDYLNIFNDYSASEVIEKIGAWEKKQKENEKVVCDKDCKNCIDHPKCNEDEWKLRRRGIVPEPPKEKQSEKSCKDCKYFYHGYFTIACFDCKDFSLFEPKKEEQTEKSCEIQR